MQELVGRLTALDPEASETLKVVSFFDALVTGGAGIEAIVRGAATLSGVAAGARWGSDTVRVSPRGERLPPAADAPEAPAAWSEIALVDGGTGWIERDGAPHANDAMVLERFALAIALTRKRRRPESESAVAIALDAARPPAERTSAIVRLGLAPHDRVRVWATSADTVPNGPSTVIATPRGPVRATIVRVDPPATARVGAGAGTWGAPTALPRSWEAASLARRLASPSADAVDAEDLGVLLDAAAALSARPETHVDVAGLTTLDARSRQLLRALVESDSVRAAAVALGMHHSTLQVRHEAFTRELGYDPRSPRGRARYELADLLRRLHDDAGQ